MSIFDAFRKLEEDRKKSEAAPTVPLTHLVVGLGNPGKEYLYTRHNAGFLAVDAFCAAHGIHPIEKIKFHSLVGEVTVGGVRALVMKPQTYMNASGEAVREAAAFYKIPPERIIVLSDDIYLEPGRVRVRAKGSDGGHNGLKNIIYHLNSDAFPRIRIGVGIKPKEYDMVSYVVSKLPEGDLAAMRERHGDITQGIEALLSGQVEKAMQICNKASPAAQSDGKGGPV